MRAQNPAAPTLSIRPAPNQSIRLSWTNAATGFVVESASVLGDATLWRPISQTPTLEDNQYSVTLDASAPNNFFRLHLPALTGIR